MERLTPLERAVFVLREVFDFGFPEIAEAIGPPPAWTWPRPPWGCWTTTGTSAPPCVW